MLRTVLKVWVKLTNKEKIFSGLNQINFCSSRTFSTQILHGPQIVWPQNSSFLGDDDDNLSWYVLAVNVFWNVNQAKNSFKPRGCGGWPMIKNIACQLISEKKRLEQIWRSKICCTKILFHVERGLYKFTKNCLYINFLYIHSKASKKPHIAVPIIMNNPVERPQLNSNNTR